MSHYVEDTSTGKLVYRLRQTPDGDELIAYEGAPLGIRRVYEVSGEIQILPVAETVAAVA
ncbi:MAG: hypothetical protein Q4F60_00850 [Candidatus Saccharibacteria bacterium]|nr:hypothetical protein [Candidatus Saccharibacteria bacterium]